MRKTWAIFYVQPPIGLRRHPANQPLRPLATGGGSQQLTLTLTAGQASVMTAINQTIAIRTTAQGTGTTLTNRIAHAFAAIVESTASVLAEVASHLRTFTATAASAATLSKLVAAVRTVGQGTSTVRATTVLLTRTLIQTAALTATRTAIRTLSVAAASTPTVAKAIARALVKATQASTGAIANRAVTHVFSAIAQTANPILTTAARLLRTLTTATASVPVLVKTAGVVRSAAAATATAMTRMAGVVRTRSQGTALTTAKSIAWTRVAAQAATASTARVVSRALAAAQPSALACVRGVLIVRGAAAPTVGVAVRKTLQTLATTQASAIAISKRVAHVFATTTETAAAVLIEVLAHLVTLTASVGSAATLTKAVALSVSAAQALTMALTRAAGVVRTFHAKAVGLAPPPTTQPVKAFIAKQVRTALSTAAAVVASVAEVFRPYTPPTGPSVDEVRALLDQYLAFLAIATHPIGSESTHVLAIIYLSALFDEMDPVDQTTENWVMLRDRAHTTLESYNREYADTYDEAKP